MITAVLLVTLCAGRGTMALMHRVHASAFFAARLAEKESGEHFFVLLALPRTPL